ncbi:MAG: VacJ family lipoprotein, partial [Desulfobacteraceae bacterium]
MDTARYCGLALAALLFFFQAAPAWTSEVEPIPLTPSDVYEVYGASAAGGAETPVDQVLAAAAGEDVYEDPWADEYDNDMEAVPDPLEPLNRAFYHFNDKLYFWVIKPAAQGYRAVVPEKGRVGVRNFFYNLAFPVRLVNCLLQLKGQEAGYEFARFIVNSTVGMAGLIDVAGTSMGLEKYEEDLGQTLGHYGAGPSIFINWPFLGPSCVRDSIGMAGDAFLNPVNYLQETKYLLPVKALDTVNEA